MIHKLLFQEDLWNSTYIQRAVRTNSRFTYAAYQQRYQTRICGDVRPS